MWLRASTEFASGTKPKQQMKYFILSPIPTCRTMCCTGYSPNIRVALLSTLSSVWGCSVSDKAFYWSVPSSFSTLLGASVAQHTETV